MALRENDFLTFHLYTASKTPRIRKSRLRSWIISTLVLASLAYLFFESGNDFLGNYFLTMAAVTLIFFPLYSRWRYKVHYLRFVRDTYKNRIGERYEFEITSDMIITRDKTSEVRIKKSEIEEINEIRDYYFLKTSTGTTLLVLKENTKDFETIEKEIRTLCSTPGIHHNAELEWKWK